MSVASFWLGFAIGFMACGLAVIVGLVVKSFVDVVDLDAEHDYRTSRPVVEVELSEGFDLDLDTPDQRHNPRGKP